MKHLPLIFLLVGALRADYVPGTPGGDWTEDQAAIIRDKFIEIWQNEQLYSQEFDNNRTNPKFSDWLYDPTLRLSTVDCNWKEKLCQSYWTGKRSGNLAFGPEKAIRCHT